jgi:hypothetical protein
VWCVAAFSLKEKHPQILPSDRIFFDQPFKPNPSYAAEIEDTMKLLEEQASRESAYSAARPPIKYVSLSISVSLSILLVSSSLCRGV